MITTNTIFMTCRSEEMRKPGKLFSWHSWQPRRGIADVVVYLHLAAIEDIVFAVYNHLARQIPVSYILPDDDIADGYHN